jgi:glucose-6-phosphate dehydrogenase assembly protein OpcA
VSQSPALIRTAHASGLNAVAHELTALHGEMLRAGEEGSVPVRLSSLTLVTACTDEAGTEAAHAVASRIAETTPARIIFIVADPAAAEASITADLSLQCSIRGGGQVCAEQVQLRVAGEPARHLLSVVAPLLLPDVPVYLWVVGAPPLDQALSGDVSGVCERIILDSNGYADTAKTLMLLATHTSIQRRLRLADLAWVRGRRWRELLAQAFDGAGMPRYLRGLQRLAVTTAGERPCSDGWLIAGWVTSRVRPTADEHFSPALEMATISGSDGAPRLAAIELEARADGRTARVRLAREQEVITASLEVEGGPNLVRSLPAADPSTAELVGSILQETDVDPIHLAALRAAALADNA